MSFDNAHDSHARADALYGRIVSLLQRELPGEALPSALELAKADYDRERGVGLLALVHLQLENFEAAIELLEQCVQEFGESGSTLTNLSKANYSMGRHDLATTLARRSLHLDPNQSAGLIWYATLEQERRGPEAVPGVFDEISQEVGSWRALLWKARAELRNGNLDQAMGLYRRALSMGYDSDALLMISGDLGGNGAPEQAILLVADRYDRAAHSAHVGVNLLQSYLSAGRREEGERLLSTMGRAELGDLYEWYADAFSKITF